MNYWRSQNIDEQLDHLLAFYVSSPCNEIDSQCSKSPQHNVNVDDNNKGNLDDKDIVDVLESSMDIINSRNVDPQFQTVKSIQQVEKVSRLFEEEKLIEEKGSSKFCYEPYLKDTIKVGENIKGNDEQINSQSQRGHVIQSRLKKTKHIKKPYQILKQKNNYQISQRKSKKDKNNSQQIKKLNTIVKLDQGFKILLRGFRETLYQVFKEKGYAKGKSHWDNEKLFNKVEDFIKKYLEIETPPKSYIQQLSLLLIPVRGLKDKKYEIQGLSQEQITLFREIYNHNNKERREKFLTNDFIRKIWEKIVNRMDKELIFKQRNPNKNLLKTFKLIGSILQEKGLALPEFWVEEFSDQINQEYCKQ